MSRQNKLVVFVAVLASLLEIVDSSIVNVALPTMMGNLGATLEDISMVVTGYAIANAIILPVASWLSDRFGLRRYYLGCIAIFTATSIACGLAPNLTTLIIFRIFQGLAGGALLPTSQSLIYEAFGKEKAGMAGAIFGMSVMVGPALGPVLGGYLTDEFGWRMIFNVNLPLGILAFVMGSIAIFDPAYQTAMRGKERPPLDTFGLVLLVLGIGCLQFTLERGEADEWFASTLICVNAVIAAVSLPMFVWWELRAKAPMINVRLFLDPIVRGGVIMMGCVGFFLYGVVFLLPTYLTRMYHFDATQIGVLFIPGSIVTIFMMPFVGRAMQSGFNPKILVFIGFIGIEITLYLMTLLSPLSDRSQVLTTLYMRGFAMAFLFVPINSAILSQFSGAVMGQVSGLMNLARQIGGSFSIAMVGTLLTTRTAQNMQDMMSRVTLLNANVANYFRGSALGLSLKMPAELGLSKRALSPAFLAMWGKMQQQAFMMSFLQLIFIMMICVSFAFIPLAMMKFKRSIKVVDAH